VGLFYGKKMSQEASKFNIIYALTGKPVDDFKLLKNNIDAVCEGFGAKAVICDDEKLSNLAGYLSSADQDFPHVEGFSKASPFKKAGYFFTAFCEHSPIQKISMSESQPYPFNNSGLNNISNHLNPIVALIIVALSLKGITITQKDGVQKIISNGINLSEHFFCDVVEAYSAQIVTASAHYKVAALMFESLVYQENPELCYEKVIKLAD
jgi:hypothetical protein